MMYQIKFTSAYKKSYRLLIKRGFDITLLDEVIEKLANGYPLEPKYKITSYGVNLTAYVNVISSPIGYCSIK